MSMWCNDKASSIRGRMNAKLYIFIIRFDCRSKKIGRFSLHYTAVWCKHSQVSRLSNL